MKKESKSQAQKQGREHNSHGLAWYWGLAVAGLVLMTAVLVSVSMFQYTSNTQELMRQQTLTGAQALVGRLARVNLIRSQILSNIASDPDLTRLFKARDKAGLKAEETRIRIALPGALRVRLLQVGTNLPDTSVTPHMGFASLAQLRLAEQKSGVRLAEVHQFNTPHQHVSLVVGVREHGTGPLVGLIHAAFPFDELASALEAVKNYGGRVAVRQKAPDAEPFELVHTGPERMSSPPVTSLPVEGSIWEVAFWDSSGLFMSRQNSLILGAGIVLVLVVTGLLYFITVLVRKALKLDQKNVLSLVEALLVGRPPKRSAAQLADMQPMLDVLYHQIKEHRVKIANLSKGASTFSNVPDGVMAVEQTAGIPTMPAVSADSVELSATIFRAYDIRGVVGETLNPDVYNLLGQSLGSEIYENGLQSVVVGRDGRDSSEALHSALIAGLQATGRDVIDVGLVPTPVLYFAAYELKSDAAAMVTGSHNAKEYNGLKIMLNGESPSPDAIQGLRRRIDAGQLLQQGQGTFDSQEIVPLYIDRIVSDIRLARPMKLVIDCGNGAAAVVAPELYRQLGCEVVELFCEVDGSFPNHHPDPGEIDNMEALQQAVVEHQADLGLAFDGDGDRLGVVDSGGKLIWPDRLLMYLAIDVLTREPGGDIIYDVKCSRHLANVVLSNGGRPLMWKSGHSMLKAKMKETNALLAGEFSGHVIFSERWYGFDDGLYAGARLLEVLSLDYRSSAEAFMELPEGLATPEYKVPIEEGQGRELMQALNQHPDLPDARMVRIDGLRAEFEQGWGLVRASNTTPALIFRFEADTTQGLEYVKDIFRDMMKTVAPNLKMPF